MAPYSEAGILDFEPSQEDFLEAVLKGLNSSPRSLPTAFLYDAEGSALFERICDLPEYYPTRTEIALLRAHAPSVARIVGEDCRVIEFGSGSARKIRILLDSLAAAIYVPVDISREFLADSAAEVSAHDPRLTVTPVCADYNQPFTLPERPANFDGTDIIFFPGSTIGNLSPDGAFRLLKRANELIGSGYMLVGADLDKDPAVLTAAYDDASGVTAAFNLNLLARINRELGGTFDLRDFRHEARYEPEQRRIEMHLTALRETTASIGGEHFRFAVGDSIHTENSHKFSISGFQDLAKRSGWRPVSAWQDANHAFSLHLLSCGPA